MILRKRVRVRVLGLRNNHQRLGSKILWPSSKETLDVPVELEEPAVEPNSVEELLDRVVAEVEKIIAEQQATPIASSKVDFDCGESTSAEESKTTELSVADILSE